MKRRLVVISPCRNEEQFILLTLRSVVNQTYLPDVWIIVDDSSSDATPKLVERVAADYPWIRLVRRQREGKRQLGPGVVDAFNAGLAYLGNQSFEVIAKLDCDLEFEPGCFSQIMSHFDDPRVGITGGTTSLLVGSKLVSERYSDYHVPGATKFYRRECFKDIGGLRAVYGWDIIDETDARRHGWLTSSDPTIIIIHHRMQGKTLGTLRGRIIWGQGAFAIGSHPLFAFARGLFRLAERPWVFGGLAFLWGYFSNYLYSGVERVTDGDLIGYLRREQLYRLTHGNRLPPKRDGR